MRSAADSMPTERRTRFGGAANGAVAVDACVMRAGTSIRLSTPPSDSASWKSFVRADERDRLLLGDSARNETMPPKSRIWRAAIAWPRMRRQAGIEDALDARVPLEPRRRPPSRSRSAGACARASVLIPRSTSQQSNGPGTAPSDFCRK